MNTESKFAPGSAPGRTRRRVAIALTLLVTLVWTLGFLRFVGSVPRVAPGPVEPADAIVVLTGGAKRLAVGFRLLMDGKAEKLLVSGVNADVRLREIQALSAERGVLLPGALLTCCVQLGYKAEDTRGNARETADWARARGARSLLLVTSNYHMARSRLEFERVMPDVVIQEYPVVADALMLKQWWRWPGSMKLLWVEYHKFVLAGLRGIAVDLVV
jgi:uncharacterized SAM-binding protein YcdF (DUF218 family)